MSVATAIFLFSVAMTLESTSSTQVSATLCSINLLSVALAQLEVQPHVVASELQELCIVQPFSEATFALEVWFSGWSLALAT